MLITLKLIVIAVMEVSESWAITLCKLNPLLAWPKFTLNMVT
jgi:hypothetical protein